MSCLRSLGVLALATAAAAALTPSAHGGEPAANTSRFVFPGADGKLDYVPYTADGDRIPDFSYCGYRGGGVAIPSPEPTTVLEPIPGNADDLPRLQEALDSLAARPLGADGFRGVLLLRKGEYRLNGTLAVTAGGIVIRGEGDGPDGTVLIATLRKQHTLVEFRGGGKLEEIPGTRVAIADDCVPVGAREFSLAGDTNLKPGDAIVVHRPSTSEWIREIGMDRIPGGDHVRQWTPGSRDLRFLRVVRAVNGNRITVDAPIVNAIRKEYGGGSVYAYRWPERITRIGIEDVRGMSEFDGEDDENHGWDFVRFINARDGWARRITSVHFGYSCVGLTSGASRITVEDSRCLDPVSKVTGGRRYSFHISGQLNLVQRCYTRNGRHDFVMHSVVPGPNVFLNCRADNARADSGPHHRWATGTLYDNVVVNGNYLNVENAGGRGTGHGWTGAQMVFWNCTAKGITCQKPPTAMNFAIGCTGAKREKKPEGIRESPDTPVSPRSLYRRQLADRLGDGALEVLGGEDPRIVTE